LINQYTSLPGPAAAPVPIPSPYAVVPQPEFLQNAPLQPQQYQLPTEAAAPPPPATEGPIAAMNKEQQKFALSLIRTVKKHKMATPFLRPVDAIALGIPDYYRVITQPTDLTNIENRLNATGRAIGAAAKSGRTFGIDYSGAGYWEGKSDLVFRTAEEWREEVERLWLNCYKYNGPKEKNPISQMASVIEETCEKMWRNLPPAPFVEVSVFQYLNDTLSESLMCLLTVQTVCSSNDSRYCQERTTSESLNVPFDTASIA
jgi:bromodomain-containing factor 1